MNRVENIAANYDPFNGKSKSTITNPPLDEIHTGTIWDVACKNYCGNNPNAFLDDSDEDMPPKAKPAAGGSGRGGQEKGPRCQEDDKGRERQGCRDVSPCPAPAKKNFSIDATNRFLVTYYGKGVNNYTPTWLLWSMVLSRKAHTVYKWPGMASRYRGGGC